jgi:hypothetical protein
MLIKPADINPPEIAPTKMLESNIKAVSGFRPYVIGIARATPIVAVKPGMAPKMMPHSMPSTMIAKFNGWKSAIIPVENVPTKAFIAKTPPLAYKFPANLLQLYYHLSSQAYT